MNDHELDELRTIHYTDQLETYTRDLASSFEAGLNAMAAVVRPVVEAVTHLSYTLQLGALVEEAHERARAEVDEEYERQRANLHARYPHVFTNSGDAVPILTSVMEE